jgi:uncharacterized protein with NAD-binding domain and iron-sulfur cluster
VLGGGAAGLAAAFELSDPAHGGRFEVTVHSLGWRLGGKGASGRNAARHDRIEEHGLHLWFGFYEQALDLMRRAYAAAGPDAPAPTAAQAFAPVARLGLWERGEGADGPWSRWQLPLPHRPLEDRPAEPIAPGDYVEAIARWLLAVWDAREDRISDELPPPALVAAAEGGRLTDRDGVGLLAEAARDLAGRGTGRRLLAQLADFWAGVLGRARETGVLDGGGWDAEALAAADEEDFRTWLAPRLQFDHTLQAPFLRSLYDLIFAYEDGDRARPRAAAGMAVRNLFRIAFEHRGSLMLRMRGGMGDVVFAPLYHALRRRGVAVELFRAVTGVRQRDGRVDAVEMVEQARLAGGGYAPLLHVGTTWAWPGEPLWEQLAPADAAALRERGADLEREPNPLGRPARRLERGRDFDAVVLAIPVGALPPLCSDLAAAHAPFARMLEHAATVPTQAAQLWLCGQAPQGGLAAQPGSVSGAYDAPFDTCADFAHLVGLERWPEGSEVAQIAYAVGVLPAAGQADQAGADAAVARNVAAFVDRHPARDELRGLLADRAGRPGGTLADQYWRANVAPGERYALSPPGSMRHRLAPGESGFANLALAGDWTRTPVNAGCVEAAVASGRMAAAAVVAMEAA